MDTKIREPNLEPTAYLRNGAECLLLLDAGDKYIGCWQNGETWQAHEWDKQGKDYGFYEFTAGTDRVSQLDIIIWN